MRQHAGRGGVVLGVHGSRGVSTVLGLALEVGLAWLMPWRAVQRIRSQERAIIYLTGRVLAIAQDRSLAAAGGPRRRRHLHVVR